MHTFPSFGYLCNAFLIRLESVTLTVQASEGDAELPEFYECCAGSIKAARQASKHIAPFS